MGLWQYPRVPDFFVEGEVNPESIVRGKWKGVVAGTKGAHVRGAEVSGDAGENILSNRVTPKLKMAKRNQKIMGEKGSRGTWISRNFFVLPPHQQQLLGQYFGP